MTTVGFEVADLNGELPTVRRPYWPLRAAFCRRNVSDLTALRTVGIHDKDSEAFARFVLSRERNTLPIRRPMVVPRDWGAVIDLSGVRAVERRHHQTCCGPRSGHIDQTLSVG